MGARGRRVDGVMRAQTLDDFGGEWRPSGDQMNFRLSPCCASQNYKLYVASETGLWHCFRCGAGGKVSVPMDAGALRRRFLNRGTSSEVEWRPIDLPKGTTLGRRAGHLLVGNYQIWMEQAQGLGMYESEGRVIVPYCDAVGDVIYFTGRTFTGQEPKYWNAPGRHPLYVPRYSKISTANSDSLVLVEGPMDAAKVFLSCIENVAAIGGKSLPRYMLREVLKMEPRRVRVMLDADAMAASIKLAAQLVPFVDVVERITLPQGQDPGSMDPDAIRRLLRC